MMTAARPVAATSRLRLVVLLLALMQIGAWLGTVQRAAALPPHMGAPLVHHALAAPVQSGPRCHGIGWLIRSCAAVVVAPAAALPIAPATVAVVHPPPLEVALRGRVPSPEPPPPRA